MYLPTDFHDAVFMYVCMCGEVHRELLDRAGAISSGIWGLNMDGGLALTKQLIER